MLSFLGFIIAFVAAVGVPGLLGIAVLSAWGARNSRALAAFAFGILLFYFSDTFADSSYLGLNEGIGGAATWVPLITLMAVGLIGISAASSILAGSGDSLNVFPATLVAALAMSVHGIGEGSAVAGVASSTDKTVLLEAFGGLGSAAAFVLHKFLEGAVVGIVYVNTLRLGDRVRWRQVLLIAGVFIIPGIVGAGAGYFANFDSTFSFALALGASVFVFVTLARSLAGDVLTLKISVTMAASLFAGFLFMFISGLLHS